MVHASCQLTAAVLRNKFQGKCSINAVTPAAAHVVSIDSASLQTNGSVTKPLAHLGTVFPRGQHIYVLVSCWSRGCVLPPSRPNSDRHDPGSLVVLLLLLPTSHATLARDSTLDLFVYRTARSNPQCANSMILNTSHLTTHQSGSNPCVPRS